MGKRPRLMLAAPASGSGKTTLTIGLLQALVNRGVKPAAFKCGPDYIDPMFHRQVLGLPGYNLDLFFTPPRLVRALLNKGAQGAGVSVLEGVMGYYDGQDMQGAASSWQLAVQTETPVVLVAPAQGAALSVAALVKGFVSFRPNSGVSGVILNGCGAAMCAQLAPVIEKETGIKVYGCLPHLPEATLQSRHLGLVTPDEVKALRQKTRALAAQMEKTVDIDGLLALAATAPPLKDTLPAQRPVCAQPVPIAIAQDAAFCFYYAENLQLLEKLGARLVPFSPLRDKRLPAGVRGLYLGGGYPELHAAALAQNEGMRGSIGAAVRRGLPTLAECGGFMYLQQRLQGKDGTLYPMVGALPGECKNTGRLGRFGYINLTAQQPTLLCGAGGRIGAHEFHYWDSTDTGAVCTAQKPGSGKMWGCVQAGKSLFAGFPHLYFWSNPAFARSFVRAAADYTETKEA